MSTASASACGEALAGANTARAASSPARLTLRQLPRLPYQVTSLVVWKRAARMATAAHRGFQAFHGIKNIWQSEARPGILQSAGCSAPGNPNHPVVLQRLNEGIGLGMDESDLAAAPFWVPGVKQ